MSSQNRFVLTAFGLSLFLISCSISPSANKEANKEPKCSLSIALEKESFAEGEPIKLTLTVSNEGMDPFKFEMKNPWARWTSFNKLTFHSDDPAFGLQSMPFIEYDGLVPAFTLKSGEKREFTLFLQRYVKQPLPGDHEVNYECELPIRFQPPEDKGYVEVFNPHFRPFAEGKGKLVFKVEPSRKEELEKIYSHYLDLIKESASRQEADEALSVVEDPLVVPFLLQAGLHGGTQATWALARFPKVKEAQEHYLSLLKGSPDNILCGLAVLAEWKYELPLAEVRRLMQNEKAFYHDAAVQYIKAVNKPEYLDLLKKPGA